MYTYSYYYTISQYVSQLSTQEKAKAKGRLTRPIQRNFLKQEITALNEKIEKLCNRRQIRS